MSGVYKEAFMVDQKVVADMKQQLCFVLYT